MKQYLNDLKFILENGDKRGDRTGTGTLSVFGMQTRYDLREGFPLVTTKKVNFSHIVKELLFFLRAETNVKDLDCPIWNPWQGEDGELGPIYGVMWRKWRQERHPYTIDQIQEVINLLKTDPMSRRMIVSAWNPELLPDPKKSQVENVRMGKQVLPPCHTMFQFYATETKDGDFEIESHYLDLQLYQRSGDFMLGVPYNIASYALLLEIVARECEMIPRFLIHTLGDAHVYLNHVDAAKEQIEREPKALPKLKFSRKPIPYPFCPRDGSVYEPTDFTLEGYDPHPLIKLGVAV